MKFPLTADKNIWPYLVFLIHFNECMKWYCSVSICHLSFLLSTQLLHLAIESECHSFFLIQFHLIWKTNHNHRLIAPFLGGADETDAFFCNPQILSLIIREWSSVLVWESNLNLMFDVMIVIKHINIPCDVIFIDFHHLIIPHHFFVSLH